MNGLAKAALVAAVCTSAVAVGDAVVSATTGENLVDESSPRWWSTALSLEHAAAYVVFAVVLVRAGGVPDAGSRIRRGLRWTLTAALAMLTVVHATTPVLHPVPAALEVLAGVGFLLMFLAGAGLGVALLRVPRLRIAAALLAAPLLLLPLTVVVSSLAPDWAHPGYAEAALYAGLALLARAGAGAPARDRSQRPAPAGATQAGRGASFPV